jgi:hypothetical protein
LRKKGRLNSKHGDFDKRKNTKTKRSVLDQDKARRTGKRILDKYEDEAKFSKDSKEMAKNGQ